MCRLSNQKNNSNFICITPTNIYGEHDNFDLINSHVIPALIHKAYLAKRDDENFVIMGSGNTLRQFIYSGDIARVISYLVKNNIKTDNIILSPKEEVSIKTISQIIAKNFEISSNNIKYDTTYPDGQYKKTCDNSKLLKLIPNFEFTSLEDGLERTIQWFKKKYPNVRK